MPQFYFTYDVEASPKTICIFNMVFVYNLQFLSVYRNSNLFTKRKIKALLIQKEPFHIIKGIPFQGFLLTPGHLPVME